MTLPDGSSRELSWFTERDRERGFLVDARTREPLGARHGYLVTQQNVGPVRYAVTDIRSLDPGLTVTTDGTMQSGIETPAGAAIILTRNHDLGVLVIVTEHGIQRRPIGETDFLGRRR